VLAKTLFRLFDVTKTKQINFRVWALTLSALSRDASLEDKIKFSFSLYDLNSDKKISKDELKQLLISAIKENVAVGLTEEQADEIVSNTFRVVDTDNSGYVDYDEYYTMVMQSPSTVMASYTLDISNLCQAYRKLREHTKLLAPDIQRRKDKLATRDQEKEKIIQGNSVSSSSRAPDDSDMDLNAKPVTDRDLSEMFDISWS